MRFRWFAVVSALVLFSGIFTHNLIAQAVVDGLSKAALPQRPGSLNSQGYARERVERGDLRHGQPPSVEAASAGVVAPGFGGFAAASFVAGDGTQNAIAAVAGDFNGDGKPDVAVVDLTTDIELFLNDGKGNFTTHSQPYNTQQIFNSLNIIGARYIDAVAADLNGDGFADLILEIEPGTVGSNSLLVLLNQKDGTFGSAFLLTLPAKQSWYYIAVAKTTSGYFDIVTVQYHYPSSSATADGVLIQTFHNSGTGSFTPGTVQTFSLPASQLPFDLRQIALADVNHDGKQDVLLEVDVGNYPQHFDYIDIFQGNGDGTFQLMNANTTVTFPDTKIPSSSLYGFVVQSLTSDESKKDLILNSPTGVFTALSNGDGTYKKPVLVSSEAGVSQVHVVDLNGDGNADLIASNFGSIETLLGNGDGTFGGITGANYAYSNLNAISFDQTVIADFNGDGKLDFANVDYQGDVQVGFGKGDGNFIATPLLYSAISPALLPSQFTAESDPDLNGDGVPDLLAFGDPDGSMLSAVTNAAGGFTFHVALPISAYSQLAFILPVAADFNGDGKQDAVMSGYDESVAVALSNGDGTLNPNVTVITLASDLRCLITEGAVAGDINGDGKMDLVIPYGGDVSCGLTGGAASGYFTVLGNGDGTFMTPTFHAVGTEVTAVALGKFHGTTQPLDLVVSSYTDNAEEVLIYKGDGAGNFTKATVLVSVSDNLTFPISQILTDDFNSDGKPDITLVGGPYYGGPELFAGNGDGTFGEVQYADQDTYQTSAVYADLNGDGIPDLIGSDTSTDLSVNLGTGNGAFAAPIHYFFAAENLPLFAGKFLGDNTQSILSWGGGTAFFMNQGGTSLVVTPSAASVTAGQSVTLTASLTATLTGQPAPTGTVTFFDGTTQIGSEAVGTPLVLASPALGVHSITAKYSGDGHFNPNTSTAVTVTVAAPPPADFTFTSTGGSLTVAKGGSGTLSLTVAANASLSAAVTFACSGLPSEASCGFSPASLNVAAGTSGNSMLTISTKAASANVRLRADGRSGRFGQSGRSGLAGLSAAAMAGLMCLLLPRRRGTWLVLAVVLGLGAVAGLSGCGGGSKVITPTGPSDPGTPAGTSNVTVTATAVSGSTTVSHTMTVALTVQ